MCMALVIFIPLNLCLLADSSEKIITLTDKIMGFLQATDTEEISVPALSDGVARPA